MAPELDPILRPFLTQLSGHLRGDELVLTPLNSYIRGMVNRPELLDKIRSKASQVLGRPLRLQLGEPGGFSGEDKLRQLAEQFGNLDNINIQS